LTKIVLTKLMSGGGVVLGIATLAALIVANSALGPQYRAFLEATGEVRVGSLGLSKDIEHWINDGLMAIFFLLVGLEIKREVIEGSLAGVQNAALPILAAIGGFLVPAALYVAVNWLCGVGRCPTRLTLLLQSGFARCSAGQFRHR
jgi:Na+:H+ antiporter, NhaA family